MTRGLRGLGRPVGWGGDGTVGQAAWAGRVGERQAGWAEFVSRAEIQRNKTKSILIDFLD
jgi:hypothetical protein